MGKLTPGFINDFFSAEEASAETLVDGLREVVAEWDLMGEEKDGKPASPIPLEAPQEGEPDILMGIPTWFINKILFAVLEDVQPEVAQKKLSGGGSRPRAGRRNR